MTASYKTRADAMRAYNQATKGKLGRFVVTKVLTAPALVFGLRWEFDIEVEA